MEHAPNFSEREDTLSKYLESQTKDFLFDELSPEYLDSNNMSFMKGVAVPFKAKDMVELAQTGINPARLADNMAIVVGSNTKFPYAQQYIKFMASFFNDKLISVFTSKGAEALMGDTSEGKKDYFADAPDFGLATAYYRMALMLDSTDALAMFGYACACREWYLSLEGRDGFDQLIELLKSEATEYFEWCIIEHPEFSPSYYYLGYAYLNAALYTKAQFVWNRYLDLADNTERPEYEEIKARVAELNDPVRIEEGINKLTVGDLESGLKILEPYVDSEYSNWWPLHYYLACTYRELEHPEEAIEGFKKVLSLNPSNYDACVALAEIFDELGDKEMHEKYYNKSKILEK